MLSAFVRLGGNRAGGGRSAGVTCICCGRTARGTPRWRARASAASALARVRSEGAATGGLAAIGWTRRKSTPGNTGTISTLAAKARKSSVLTTASDHVTNETRRARLPVGSKKTGFAAMDAQDSTHLHVLVQGISRVQSPVPTATSTATRTASTADEPDHRLAAWRSNGCGQAALVGPVPSERRDASDKGENSAKRRGREAFCKPSRKRPFMSAICGLEPTILVTDLGSRGAWT